MNEQPAAKYISESETQYVSIVMYEQTNGAGRLFGGKLVEWMDIAAAVCARRHSNRNVTTASIDTLQFNAPAYVNDTISVNARIVFVGKTSMKVRVDVFTEALNGERKQVNTAYFTMVALDENDKPTPVPRLLLNTDAERAEYAEFDARRRK